MSELCIYQKALSYPVEYSFIFFPRELIKGKRKLRASYITAAEEKQAAGT